MENVNIYYHKNRNKNTQKVVILSGHYPVNIYLFKVNNGNTWTIHEIFSKLTIKTPEWRHWRRSGVFIVKFEHISCIVQVFSLLTLSK